MFERYKKLSRKQKDREFYEQFWGTLSDLARSCEIGINAEQEWISDEDYFPEDPQARIDKTFCGVINYWTEEGTIENDDYSVLNIRPIYDTNGLETKKLVKNGLGEDAIVNLIISVDPASPISFLKQNVLHKLKLRYPHLKIHPVEKTIRELFCGLTNDTINIIGKIIVRMDFFITTGHKRNILGNDNLPRIGIEIAKTTTTTSHQCDPSRIV